MQPGVKSGTIWIAYSWQDTQVAMKKVSVPVAFMNPSWFTVVAVRVHAGAHTKNYHHAHDYVGHSSTTTRARR
jgi:hypothetical protein